jgi:hypothetical protein
MRGNNQIQVFVLEVEFLRNGAIGNAPLIGIHTFGKPWIVKNHSVEASQGSYLYQHGGHNIADGRSGGSRYARGNIRHAVMDYIVFAVGGA